MSASPVCVQEGDLWRPSEAARGPFGGLHGGVVGALLAAAMEREAARLGGGDGLQMSLSLLRPTPLEPVRVSVRTLRQGRRSLQLAAELHAGGSLTAIAGALFLSPAELAFVPLRAAQPTPLEGAPFEVGRMKGEMWFASVCEMRRTDAGRVWMRLKAPVVAEMGALARVVALADWATGLSRPAWVDAHGVAFPNPEISLHLHRRPEGEWLGVDSTPHWNSSGLGLTASDLYDEAGYLGRASQPVVLAQMG